MTGIGLIAFVPWVAFGAGLVVILLRLRGLGCSSWHDSPRGQPPGAPEENPRPGGPATHGRQPDMIGAKPGHERRRDRLRGAGRTCLLTRRRRARVVRQDR